MRGGVVEQDVTVLYDSGCAGQARLIADMVGTVSLAKSSASNHFAWQPPESAIPCAASHE